MSDNIKKSFDEINSLQNKLMSMNDLTTWTNFEPIFRKNLLLSCASYYESCVYNKIKQLFTNSNHSKVHLTEFTMNSLNRRYHTLFDWNGNNTNSFLKLFGDEKKNKIRIKIESDMKIKSGEKHFIEIGNRRNILVHNNFSIATVDLSINDIYNHHKEIIRFLDFLFEEVSN